MRTIKFRGLYKGMFVYGNLIQGLHNGKPFTEIEHSDSSDFHKWEVIPETVGQFTGLTDKHGKEIYEGDVIKRFYFFNDGGVDLHLGIVTHNQLEACYYLHSIKNELSRSFGIRGEKTFYEIIGNIHQNPELI